MSSGAQRPFVSVKFSPVGRTYTFLLPELSVDADLPALSSDASSQDSAPGSGEPAASRQEPAAETQDSAASRRPRFSPGDAVVVQTAEGRALGTVTRSVAELAARKSPAADSELQVVRRATREDVVTRLKHQHREQEAQRICLMKIRERGLAMKLTRVEQLFDGSRLIFYYTAEGRVDFRELVRDLAAHFRVRIEMRQIGVRDEARMLGGYGSCGRPLCCTTFLQTFEPISIKMAKQQNLSLNPSKLSGMCGRLKCCLRYELPNGKGVKHGGCADEGGCGSCSNPTGPGGGGGCGSCGPGGCGKCG
jgi:cell fate regulator YaaT (PSP1 superfamily)